MSNKRNVQQRPGLVSNRQVEAADMMVTCAVEAAAARGLCSLDDTRGFNAFQRNQYVRLCRTEQGVTKWADPD